MNFLCNNFNMKYYPNYLSADDMPENDEEVKENPATENDNNDEEDPENEEGLEPYDEEEDEK